MYSPSNDGSLECLLWFDKSDPIEAAIRLSGLELGDRKLQVIPLSGIPETMTEKGKSDIRPMRGAFIF